MANDVYSQRKIDVVGAELGELNVFLRGYGREFVVEKCYAR